ncbi:MAG: PDZ domain-containing protein, partial [Acidobacteriota bacterium]
IGINSAISSRASNIGFAVPINQAVGILDQLKAKGRVSRGYMGVLLTDVTPALQHALSLGAALGALVQDVTAGSPAERAGLHPYDVILDVEGHAVGTNEELIRDIAARLPGTTARLGVMREARRMMFPVKLAERPQRDDGDPRDGVDRPAKPRAPERAADSPLGLTVRELDRAAMGRLDIPDSIQGVIVSRVDPTGAAFSASVRRGFVLMEINRKPIRTVADFQGVVSAAHPGDVLALYYYDPTLAQRALLTVTVE